MHILHCLCILHKVFFIADCWHACMSLLNMSLASVMTISPLSLISHCTLRRWHELWVTAADSFFVKVICLPAFYFKANCHVFFFPMDVLLFVLCFYIVFPLYSSSFSLSFESVKYVAHTDDSIEKKIHLIVKNGLSKFNIYHVFHLKNAPVLQYSQLQICIQFCLLPIINQ